MNSSVILHIDKDEMKVTLRELSPGCTLDMIRNELNAQRITHGIFWKKIEEAIATVTTSNVSLTNILIAEMDFSPYSIEIGNLGPTLSSSQITQWLDDLKQIGDALRTDNTSCKIKNGIYCTSLEPFLSIHFNDRRVNVYGESIPVSRPEQPFKKEKVISAKNTPDGFELIAKTFGYLIINFKGALDIVDPFFASSDRLTLYCAIIPLINGKDDLFDKIQSTQALSSDHELNMTDFMSFTSGNHIIKKPVRQGREPIQGRPGSIKIVVPQTPPQQINDNSYIDYRDSHVFQEIEEGTVLVERIPMIQSSPGIDVFGKVISVTEVKDVVFSYGDGVIEERTSDLIRYKAKSHGILELNENYVNICPELIIKGDVCSATGNIHYSKTVIVHGSVSNGFSIKCHDLTIHGSIEEGTEIVCSGNLTVRKGILGERTKILVKGDAKIGFIQNAYLRVQGNCTIEEYSYHGKIFCRNLLHVNGKGLMSRAKGAVMGGSICSLNALDLHSAGTNAALTTLSCGFDPETMDKVTETIKIENNLKKKIIQLQNRINFNPSNKQLLLQRIQHFSPEKRQELKDDLQELKSTITQAEHAGASISLLSRKAVAADISQSTIIIRKHLIPQTLIMFPHSKKKIYQETSNISFTFEDDMITLHNGCLTNRLTSDSTVPHSSP